ncbi:MAG: DNA-binding domain-containing protein [Rickettsiales bacterium]|nr:DNA-binding domain-containing protein [Rickettsiales bacterium]
MSKKNSSLIKTQQQFAKHIFSKSDQEILQEILHPNLEALARLDIYRNNVLGNFIAVLSSIFLVTKKILGEKNFCELAKKYCQKFPSKSGDLNEFGKKFPQFIKSCKPLYLKDLAQLELLHHHSYFFDERRKKFDLKKFKKITQKDFSDLTFNVDDRVTLFKTKLAIYSIWRQEKKIKNFTKAEFMLIYNGRIIELSKIEFLFLIKIRQGKKLYEIYKILCKENKKTFDIGTLLNRFIENGVIVDFKL